MDRNEAIAEIRKALKARTGRTWSVTGGKGSSWGWITVTAPPKRSPGYGEMNADDMAVLGKALDMDVHHQGYMVPASSAHRREAVARAQGLPYEVAAAYWD